MFYKIWPCNNQLKYFWWLFWQWERTKQLMLTFKKLTPFKQRKKKLPKVPAKAKICLLIFHLRIWCCWCKIFFKNPKSRYLLVVGMIFNKKIYVNENLDVCVYTITLLTSKLSLLCYIKSSDSFLICIH